MSHNVRGVIVAIEALAEIAAEIPVVGRIHPRKRRNMDEAQIRMERVQLVDPMPYPEFLSLDSRAPAPS